MTNDSSLLHYVPVPLHIQGGESYLESQACNGLRRWADNFDRLTFMFPQIEAPPPIGWKPIASVGPALEQIEVVPLPMAYRPDQFLRHLPATRRRIRDLIGKSRYVGFAIGGLFGDWGAVACLEAHRMGKPYFVWTDRVESEVVRRSASDGPWKRRLRAHLTHRPMAMLERAVIRRAALGLFHGADTFAAYAPYCKKPELVHNIHIGREDHIAPDALAAKIATCAEGPLRICYAGRADPMKGPLDWVATLERLSRAGVDFQAVWLGDGAEHARMQAAVQAAGLSDRVDLPGFVSDRNRVLATLRDSHLLMFCHKTTESPRILIEALISGCPVVGYDSAFARDLISGHGGGELVPTGDASVLAERVTTLARDRAALAALIVRSARDGAPFEDRAVFRHRSELIFSCA